MVKMDSDSEVDEFFRITGYKIKLIFFSANLGLFATTDQTGSLKIDQILFNIVLF